MVNKCSSISITQNGFTARTANVSKNGSDKALRFLHFLTKAANTGKSQSKWFLHTDSRQTKQ